jgi:hypothetical protein
MSRTTRFITALLAVLLVGTSLGAQATSKSASASISAHVDGALTLSTSQNLAYGSWFVNSGLIYSNSIPTQAAWAFSITPGATISVSFTVPATLAGTGGGTMAFACGSNSALVTGSGFNTQTGNPSTGFPSVVVSSSGTGQGIVTVGQGGTGPAGGCSIDPSTAAPFRDYSGSLVATITVL